MLDLELLWPWPYPSEPLSTLRVVLPLLMGATLGAALASLVTCIEDHLTAEEPEGGRSALVR